MLQLVKCFMATHVTRGRKRERKMESRGHIERLSSARETLTDRKDVRRKNSERFSLVTLDHISRVQVPDVKVGIDCNQDVRDVGLPDREERDEMPGVACRRGKRG